jgi:hypothetical protein
MPSKQSASDPVPRHEYYGKHWTIGHDCGLIIGNVAGGGQKPQVTLTHLGFITKVQSRSTYQCPSGDNAGAGMYTVLLTVHKTSERAAAEVPTGKNTVYALPMESLHRSFKEVTPLLGLSMLTLTKEKRKDDAGHT